MSKKLYYIGLFCIISVMQLRWSTPLLAASSGELAVSVTVAEKCSIDFSEGSADFFQVCSAAPGVSNERSTNVLGASIAIDPAADPYYLDREPHNPSHEASPGSSPGDAANDANSTRRGPKVVSINY